MSETIRNATIVSATLEEEVSFDDTTFNKYVVDFEVDGERKNEVEMWQPKGGNAKPPTEGETGDFELVPRKGGGLKAKRVRRQGNGGGGGGGNRGGGGGVGYSTPEPDARRMSRSTALQAAVAHPKLAEADSRTLLVVAASFAEFIYTGEVPEKAEG